MCGGAHLRLFVPSKVIEHQDVAALALVCPGTVESEGVHRDANLVAFSDEPGHHMM
jgi:hypothetical protein